MGTSTFSPSVAISSATVSWHVHAHLYAHIQCEHVCTRSLATNLQQQAERCNLEAAPVNCMTTCSLPQFTAHVTRSAGSTRLIIREAHMYALMPLCKPSRTYSALYSISFPHVSLVCQVDVTTAPYMAAWHAKYVLQTVGICSPIPVLANCHPAGWFHKLMTTQTTRYPITSCFVNKGKTTPIRRCWFAN